MEHEIYGELAGVSERGLCKREASTVAQCGGWEWGLETREYEATVHLFTIKEGNEER